MAEDDLPETDEPFDMDQGQDDESVLDGYSGYSGLDEALEDALAHFTGQRLVETDQAIVSAGSYSAASQDAPAEATAAMPSYTLEEVDSIQPEYNSDEDTLPDIDLGLRAGDEVFTVLGDGSISFKASDIIGTGPERNAEDLSISHITGVEHGALVSNGNDSWTYTPDADWNGAEELTYTVTDSRGESALGGITLDVAALTEAHHAASAWTDTREDVVLSGELAAFDLSGRDLSWTLDESGAPANGTVTVEPDGAYTYTPDDNFSGLDSFTVSVSDGVGGVTQQTIAVEVDGDMVAPLTQTDTDTGKEDAPLEGLLAATSVGEDDLSFTLDTQAQNGTVAVSEDGAFTYTPDEGFSSMDSFTYLVEDENGEVALQETTVLIESATSVSAEDSAASAEEVATISGTAKGVEDNALAGGDEAAAANDIEESDETEETSDDEVEVNEGSDATSEDSDDTSETIDGTDGDDNIDEDDGVDGLNLMGEDDTAGGWAAITLGEEGDVGEANTDDGELAWTVALDQGNIQQNESVGYTSEVGLSSDVSGMIAVDDGVDVELENLDEFDFT